MSRDSITSLEALESLWCKWYLLSWFICILWIPTGCTLASLSHVSVFLLHLLSLCSRTLSPVIILSSDTTRRVRHTHTCSCGCLPVGAEASLSVRTDHILPLAAALSSSEQYKSWTVSEEGKKISQVSVIRVCTCRLSPMYVWSCWAGDAPVCEDHYPGLICQYCNAAESDVCSRKFSVCL